MQTLRRKISNQMRRQDFFCRGLTKCERPHNGVLKRMLRFQQFKLLVAAMNTPRDYGNALIRSD